MTALAFDGLEVTLGGKLIVDGLSASVEDGEWVALIGPNGAGKTTALRAITSAKTRKPAPTITDSGSRSR